MAFDDKFFEAIAKQRAQLEELLAPMAAQSIGNALFAIGCAIAREHGEDEDDDISF